MSVPAWPDTHAFAMTRPENHNAIQGAIDYLTDALLSHLAYEGQELVEPLARLGFPDPVPVRG